MRYLCLVGALVFGLTAGQCIANETVEKRLKDVEVAGPGMEVSAVERVGYGVEERGQMQAGGIYDHNTGMPNVVESDNWGELD